MCLHVQKEHEVIFTLVFQALAADLYQEFDNVGFKDLVELKNKVGLR